jgi:hypothetical protein
MCGMRNFPSRLGLSLCPASGCALMPISTQDDRGSASSDLGRLYSSGSSAESMAMWKRIVPVRQITIRIMGPMGWRC